jgi:hypothetical protein
VQQLAATSSNPCLVAVVVSQYPQRQPSLVGIALAVANSSLIKE